MKCEIIKDLLPSYIDELTSDESNKEIENHIETCNNCKSELHRMKQDINIETLEINKKEIQPLRKFNEKNINIFKNISIFSLIILLVTTLYAERLHDKIESVRSDLAVDLSTILQKNDINNTNLYSNELEELLSKDNCEIFKRYWINLNRVV